MKNFQMILLTLVSFFISYSILQGWAQQYVHFAGELNEMFCCLLAFMMGVMGLIAIDYKKLWLGLN